MRFFFAPAPSNLIYIGAQGDFKKVSGSVDKHGDLMIVKRADPLGRQGVKSMK